MARRIGKLSALAVKNAKNPGLLGDGGGLYLQIGPAGTKAWLFRFMLHGRARSMGLGAFHTVSLALAREAAREARLLLRDGIDPIEDRRAKEAARRLDAVETTTFRQAARSYMDAHEKGWRNAKHAAQWRSTLATYAYPTLGDLSVQAIDTGLVLKVLEPIWNEKTETASRLRGSRRTLCWLAAQPRSTSITPNWSGGRRQENC